MENSWVVYLISCNDDSFYCGCTTDLHRRLVEHQSGKGCKYTRCRTPISLMVASKPMGKIQAMKLEAHIKSLPRAKKFDSLRKFS